MYQREHLKWNGWGWKEQKYDFAGSEQNFWPFLKTQLGLSEFIPSHALSLEQLPLQEVRLTADQLLRLRTGLASSQIKTDRFERIFHARGRSYLDLLDLRLGSLSEVPDAIVYPENSEQVQFILDFARAEQVALIPFGGGSSVVGGVNAEKNSRQKAILTLDLSRLNRLIKIDSEALTATFETGIYGPQLEQILQARGFTAGHTPQSFEFSTLGGWIAARGAGDRSNRYGKMEDILVAAKVLTPEGLWQTLDFPASAAGPDLNHLIAGSEGLFGVITEATFKIHPLVKTQHATGFLFHTFTEGVEALRKMSQSSTPPAMLRLSDEAETSFMFRFRKKEGAPSRSSQALKKILAWRGYDQNPALLLLGLEGERNEVWSALPGLTKTCLKAGGFPLGPKAGESWHKSRYNTPYLRDALLDQGIGVETLETATSWSNVLPLYVAVKAALAKAINTPLADLGQQGFVMTHISHTYHDGASLYFTFAFPMLAGQEKEQYQTIKNAACEALIAHGGTLSHHHGLGAAHAPWLLHEKGVLGQGILKAIKNHLDPDGILNPGKWFEA